MTNPTVSRWLLLLLIAPGDPDKTRPDSRQVATDYFKVSLMWEMYGELTDGISTRFRSISDIPQTREKESHSVAWRNCNMAIRTDLWRRSFSREELFPVTIQARCMVGKLGNVRKSRIAFTNFLPIRGGKLVAGITCELLFCDVSGMRKL
jgi:hypothetical protein